MNKLVTIVALCYNQSKYLVESLESIKNQTIKGFDFHIIDDCSTDNSVALIEQWIKDSGLQITLHAHEKNQGITKSMNHALSLCNTKYFQPWPCDDNMKPDKLESQIAYLESLDWTPGFLYGDCEWIDENGKVFRDSVLEERRKVFKGGKMPEGNLFLPLLKYGCFIPTASGIYVTAPLKEKGGFDENLWAEDWDMFMSLSFTNGIAFKDGVVSQYRRHSQSAEVAKGDRYWEGHFKILQKYLKTKPNYKKQIWTNIYRAALKAHADGFKDAPQWMRKAAIALKNPKFMLNAMKPVVESWQTQQAKSSILVTGMPRSGTTWAGSVLALAQKTSYVFEPFNISIKMNAGSPVKNWFETLNKHSSAEKAQTVLSYVKEKINQKTRFKSYRPNEILKYRKELRADKIIVKDPLAIFSVAWYKQEFDSPALVMVRHPAALVSSYKDHGWGVDLNNLIAQQEWAKAYPQHKISIEEFLKSDPSHLERNAFLWKIIHQIIAEDYAELPYVRVVRHEDLSKQGFAGFKPLLSFLNLKPTAQLQKFLKSGEAINVKATNKKDDKEFVSKFKKRLSESEIETIKQITYPVWTKFYTEDDW